MRIRMAVHGSWWDRDLSPAVTGDWAGAGIKALWLGRRCLSIRSRRYDDRHNVRDRKETEAAAYDIGEV